MRKLKKTDYIAYVKAVGNYDGSAMGGAYVITQNDKLFFESMTGATGKRCYEMEFRAITSVLMRLPDKAKVVIFTNNDSLVYLNRLWKPIEGSKFYNIKKVFLENKKRLRSVKIVYSPTSEIALFQDFKRAYDMADYMFKTQCEKTGIIRKYIPHKQLQRVS